MYVAYKRKNTDKQFQAHLFATIAASQSKANVKKV